jgi:transcriptional regulator with XRE-family HTH domain
MKTSRKKKSEELINLGVVFRILRQKKGYKSAEQFSYDNDLNRTAYWRWENGENMTMKSFLRLCTIHNITPRELFEYMQNKFKYDLTVNSSLVSESSEELKSK